MFNSKTTIVKKIALASLAMVAFFGLTAQTGNKVKKLYEKQEAEATLKQVEVYEKRDLTENELSNVINNNAKKECNEEIAKQGTNIPGVGRGMIITKEPVSVMIDKCVKRKAPEMWKRKDEIKETFQREMRQNIEDIRRMLTLEGCREFAEKDKECTDDLIVKFDRFGTCTCETY